jgi:hypothetical protein
MQTTMKQLDYILSNETEVLTFLKSRYPLYHLSNIFFRDIQYGIQQFLERKKMEVGYADAETIAKAFVEQLTKKKMLTAIDRQSWALNYPEFRKPPVKPVAPAKPSAPAARPVGTAPAAARPAGGLPPLKSTPVARPAGGLPPLKSATAQTTQPIAEASTVASEAPALAGAVIEPTPPAQSVASPKPTAPPTGKTLPPLGARSLPPIKSSTPVGSKK